MIALVFLGILWHLFREYQMHYNARYTAVKLGKTFRTAKGGKKSEYFFNFSGEQYEGEAPYYEWAERYGTDRRYYVRFSSKLPWINKLIDTVPARVGQPPAEGWLELPSLGEKR